MIDSDLEDTVLPTPEQDDIDESIDRIAIPVHQTRSVAKKVRTYRSSKAARELSRKNRRTVLASTEKETKKSSEKPSPKKKKATS